MHAATFMAMLLLSGGSLDHWIPIAGQWAIQDGALACQEGPGVIRTTFESDRYTLEFDYRLAVEGDAWIALNSRMTTGGPRFHLTSRGIETERRQDRTRNGVSAASGTTGISIPNTGEKRAEWIHVSIDVAPERIVLRSTGPGAPAKNIEHDPAEASRGFIRFEALQRGLEIRDLRVSEPDFAPLFDGRTLDGWEIMYPRNPGDPGWVMRDGEVVCRGRRSSWLRSLRTYDNYVLRLEYNLPPRGNSGVFQRAPITGRCSRIGFEIQLLDDYAFYGEVRPEHYTGAIYDGVAPKIRVPSPADTWNAIEVLCDGPRVRTTLNGVELYDVNLDDPTLDTNDRIRPLATRQRRGFLGLQDHNYEVRFRNVRLRELDGGP